jgi:uncharacterized membrane protein YhaH (DUF805 family)
MISCPFCDSPIDNNTQLSHCPFCKEMLPTKVSTIQCPWCIEEIPDDSTICPICDYILDPKKIHTNTMPIKENLHTDSTIVSIDVPKVSTRMWRGKFAMIYILSFMAGTIILMWKIYWSATRNYSMPHDTDIIPWVALYVIIVGITIVRSRLHDMNMSGWWWWILALGVGWTFFLLIPPMLLMVIPGTKWPNKYWQAPE